MDPTPYVVRSPLRFNSPCSDKRASDLVGRLCRDQARFLDLGCGWGELLLDLVEASERATGVGVERRSVYVARARLRAVGRGLDARVSFMEGDAGQVGGSADVVVAVGASGALGGAVFEKLRARMTPGASLLFADAVWTREPTTELRAAWGELPSEERLETEASQAGLRAVYRAMSTEAEWDAFEAGWRAPFEASEDAEARAFAAARKVGYEDGYRGVMGFGWWIFTAG